MEDFLLGGFLGMVLSVIAIFSFDLRGKQYWVFLIGFTVLFSVARVFPL